MDASRKRLFSHRFSAGGRWYFFDVKRAADGTRYLSVSESRQVDGVWRRSRLLVLEEHLRPFRDALAAAIKSLESPPQGSKKRSFAEIRARHPRAYAPWSAAEDGRLLAMHRQGAPVAVLAAEFQRRPGAIRSRLAKLTGGESAAETSEWRRLRPRAGRVWDPSEDTALLAEFDAGMPVEEIAARRGRGVMSVQVRLCKLGRGEALSGRDTTSDECDPRSWSP